MISFMEMKELAEAFFAGEINRFSDWPKELYIPGTEVAHGLFSKQYLFNREILVLRKYTDSGTKYFKESYSGSTGWEYEMMVAYACGHFFYSDPTTNKDYSKVSFNHLLEIKTETTKEGAVKDRVFINKEERGEILWEKNERPLRENLIANKQYYLGFFIHFHTHPQFFYNIGSNKRETRYSFLSNADINSLFSMNIPLLGLITNQLWLFGKSHDSTIPTIQELEHLAREEKSRDFCNLVSEIFSNHKIAVFEKSFKASKFERV